MLLEDVAPLPGGYTGVCVLVRCNGRAIHPTLDIELDGRDVDVPQDQGTLWIHVFQSDQPDDQVGVFVFGVSSSAIMCDTAEVVDAHQQKGIARSVYLFAQERSGKRAVPSTNQTQAARAFWKATGKILENAFEANR